MSHSDGQKKLPIVYVPKDRSQQVPCKQLAPRSEDAIEKTQNVLPGEAHSHSEIQMPSDTVGFGQIANTDSAKTKAHHIPTNTTASQEQALVRVEKIKPEHVPVVVGDGDLSLLKPTIDLSGDINVDDYLQVGRSNESDAIQSSRRCQNPEIYRWEQEIESFVRELSDKNSSCVDAKEKNVQSDRYTVPEASGFKGNYNKLDDFDSLVSEIADVYWDLYDSLCYENSDTVDTADCGVATGTLIRCGSS